MFAFLFIHGTSFIQGTRATIEVLPESSTDPPIAMEAIYELGSRISIGWRLGNIVASSPNGIDPYSQAFRNDRVPVHNSTLWLSIKALLDRSWFERLWIWQEVCLAKNDISLVCGTGAIDFRLSCNAV